MKVLLWIVWTRYSIFFFICTNNILNSNKNFFSYIQEQKTSTRTSSVMDFQKIPIDNNEYNSLKDKLNNNIIDIDKII